MRIPYRNRLLGIKRYSTYDSTYEHILVGILPEYLDRIRQDVHDEVAAYARALVNNALGDCSEKGSFIKAHCCQVSLVQTARWKGIFDSEDRVRKPENRYFTKGLQGQIFVRIKKLLCIW